MKSFYSTHRRRNFVDQMSVCMFYQRNARYSRLRIARTDVQENCPIFPLVNNMSIEDFIVQGLGWLHSGRHDCGTTEEAQSHSS